eukprot:COSAG02_NODE_7080_length_3194_cov_3.346189_2_plen_84_part_00
MYSSVGVLDLVHFSLVLYRGTVLYMYRYTVPCTVPVLDLVGIPTCTVLCTVYYSNRYTIVLLHRTTPVLLPVVDGDCMCIDSG